jgi:hypothetical protein
MKKLLLSVLMLTGLASFAQQDIQVTLTSPAAGDIIRKGVAFDINYTITNKGVALTSADSIIIVFTVNNSLVQTQNGPVAQLYTGGLAVGASVNRTLTGLGLNFNTAGNANICAVAILDGDSVNTADNAGCASVSLQFNVGVDELSKAAQSLSVYPNPSSDVVNFSIDYNKASSVIMMDITGRVIETVNFNMNNAQVDVRNYNAGIYMYQVLDNEGQVIKAGKVTVNN